MRIKSSYDPAKCASSLLKICNPVLATLSPREEMILRLHFGIGRKARYSLREVGKQFSLTPQRIGQIQAKAFRKLRQTPRFGSASNVAWPF
jgi:RNA polymerase primary sigma factor